MVYLISVDYGCAVHHTSTVRRKSSYSCSFKFQMSRKYADFFQNSFTYLTSQHVRTVRQYSAEVQHKVTSLSRNCDHFRPSLYNFSVIGDNIQQKYNIKWLLLAGIVIILDRPCTISVSLAPTRDQMILIGLKWYKKDTKLGLKPQSRTIVVFKPFYYSFKITVSGN